MPPTRTPKKSTKRARPNARGSAAKLEATRDSESEGETALAASSTKKIRRDFTGAEDRYLVEILSQYEPRARLSMSVYRTLAEDPRGQTHSADSWLARYRRSRAVYDARIKGFSLESVTAAAVRAKNGAHALRKPKMKGFSSPRYANMEAFGDLYRSSERFLKDPRAVSHEDQLIGLNLAMERLSEIHGVDADEAYATWVRTGSLRTAEEQLRRENEKRGGGEDVVIPPTPDVSELEEPNDDESDEAPTGRKRKRGDTGSSGVKPAAAKRAKTFSSTAKQRKARARADEREVVPDSEEELYLDAASHNGPVAKADFGKKSRTNSVPTASVQQLQLPTAGVDAPLEDDGSGSDTESVAAVVNVALKPSASAKSDSDSGSDSGSESSSSSSSDSSSSDSAQQTQHSAKTPSIKPDDSSDSSSESSSDSSSDSSSEDESEDDSSSEDGSEDGRMTPSPVQFPKLSQPAHRTRGPSAANSRQAPSTQESDDSSDELESDDDVDLAAKKSSRESDPVIPTQQSILTQQSLFGDIATQQSLFG